MLRLFLIFCSFLITKSAVAVSHDMLTAFPNVLINDDHGILKDSDIWAVGTGIAKPFYERYQIVNSYWQCFATQDVEIILHDYNDPKYGREGEIELVTRIVYNKPKMPKRILKRFPHREVALENHYYTQPHNSFQMAEDAYHLWQKLMKNQEYLCMLGEVQDEEVFKTHIDQRYDTIPDITTVSYVWYIRTITTKVGSDGFSCASYANSKVYAERYQQWINGKHNRLEASPEITTDC